MTVTGEGNLIFYEARAIDASTVCRVLLIEMHLISRLGD